MEPDRLVRCRPRLDRRCRRASGRSRAGARVRVLDGAPGLYADGRTRYFKSVAEAAAQEPPVTAALASRSAYLPPVLTVDLARRFLLMEAFAGELLTAPEDVGAWTDAAWAYGELQRQCLDAVDELRMLDCAVVTAASLAEPFATLLDDRDALLAGEPAGLGDDQVAALRALVPGLAAAAADLDAGPLPLALDHGDLGPSNVLVGPAGCAFVDWGGRAPGPSVPQPVPAAHWGLPRPSLRRPRCRRGAYPRRVPGRL